MCLSSIKYNKKNRKILMKFHNKTVTNFVFEHKSWAKEKLMVILKDNDEN